MLDVACWKLYLKVLTDCEQSVLLKQLKKIDLHEVWIFLIKLDWSAIAAIIAVGVSLVALRRQRKDLNKQAKYQRKTFTMQNELENYKIIVNLATEIIGNVQTQKQTLSRLYYVEMHRNHFEREWVETNIRKDFPDREQKMTLSGNVKDLYGAEATFLNQSTSELSRELTSKTHALDIYLHNTQYLKKVAENMGIINKLLNNMVVEISEIKDINEIPDEKSFRVWIDDHTKGIEENINQFHSVFLEIKSEMSKKVSEINSND